FFGIASACTTTFGDGRMSRRVFRQRDSNLGQCFTRFAASAGFFAFSRRVCLDGHSRRSFAETDKVNEPSLDVHTDELNLDLVADVGVFLTTNQLSLNRRFEQPNPGSFFRGASDKCIKCLADAAREELCRRGLAYLTLHLLGGILLFGA